MSTLTLRNLTGVFLTILGFGIYASNSIAFEKIVGATASSCVAVSSVNRILSGTFGGWKIVSLKDLLPEDRKTWIEHYGNNSPGYVCGNFDGNRGIDLAILVFSTNSGASSHRLPTVPSNVDIGSKAYDPNLRIRVLLFAGASAKNKPIEVLNSLTPYLPVLRLDGAGIYTDAYDESNSFQAKHDVLLLEQMESGVLGIYIDSGKVKKATLSD